MPNTNHGERNGCVSRQDLVELFLAPLSALLEKTRAELLARILSIEDSVDILARQKKRELDRK